MNEKLINSILLFSLFSVVICNNLKAMGRDDDSSSSDRVSDVGGGSLTVPKMLRFKTSQLQITLTTKRATLDEEQVALTAKVKEGDRLASELDKVASKESSLSTEAKEFETEKNELDKAQQETSRNEAYLLTQLRKVQKNLSDKNLELVQWGIKNSKTVNEIEENDNDKGRLGQELDNLFKVNSLNSINVPSSNQDSRFLPYVYGAGVALGASKFFSYVGETEELEKIKYFQFFRKSLDDSRDLQMLSVVAGCGDKTYEFLNKDSARVTSFGNGVKIGTKNVSLETANAFALRCCWDQLVSNCPEIIKNNYIVKLAHKCPEPIKKICLILSRLIIIRKCVDFEKTKFGSRK